MTEKNIEMFQHFAHYDNYYSLQTLNCILKNTNTRTHAHTHTSTQISNKQQCMRINAKDSGTRKDNLHPTYLLSLAMLLMFLENFRLMPNYQLLVLLPVLVFLVYNQM